LEWVSPNLVRGVAAARQNVLLRSRSFLDHPRVTIDQDARRLASYGLRRMIPNRSHHIPNDWYRSVERDGGPVLISIS
jgi:hypothetical protein